MIKTICFTDLEKRDKRLEGINMHHKYNIRVHYMHNADHLQHSYICFHISLLQKKKKNENKMMFQK